MAGPDKVGLARAKKVIGYVMKHRVAKALFNNPVDAEALEVPDYYDVIEQPMDFGTILERIDKALTKNGKGAEYQTVYEVLKDVKLIWHNCYSYNSRPQDSPTRELCDEVKAYFLEKWTASGLPVEEGGEEMPVEESSTDSEDCEAGNENKVPPKFSHKEDGCSLPLRLLDSFSIFAVQDQEHFESLEAVSDGIVLARGTLLLPESASGRRGSNVFEVKFPIKDWCVHYGDTSSMWVISDSAWYKLLNPTAEYAETYADLTKKIAVCSEGIAELQANPRLDVNDVVDALLSTRAANSRKKSSPNTALAEFVTKQLEAWQKAQGSGKSKRSATGRSSKRSIKPTRKVDPEGGLDKGQRRRRGSSKGTEADENEPFSGNAIASDGSKGGKGSKRTGPDAASGDTIRRSKRARKGDDDQPSSPRLKLKLGGRIVSPSQPAQLRSKGDVNEDGSRDGGRPSDGRRLKVKLKNLNKMSQESDEGKQSTPKLVVRLGTGTKDSQGMRLKLSSLPREDGSASDVSYNSEEIQEDEEDDDFEIEEGGRSRRFSDAGWLMPSTTTSAEVQMSEGRKRTKTLSTAAERKRQAQLRHQAELAARRERYHKQKEAEAARLKAEQEAAIQAKMDKERNADTARGPPPPATSTFRAPQEVLGTLLEVWEFVQSMQEVLQLPSFPLWRLEAAVCPGPRLWHTTGQSPTAAKSEEPPAPVSAYGTLPPLHMGSAADLEGAASAALLRDICMPMLTVVEAKQGGDTKKSKTSNFDLNEGWWNRVSMVLIQAAEGSINEEARAAALRLAYSDYLDLTVEQRACILCGLTHLAMDTDVVRDHISQQIEPSLKVKKQEIGGVEVKDEEQKDMPDANSTTTEAMIVPGTPEEWLFWMGTCGVGMRKHLGSDYHGRRYWVLGRKAGAWRVYVEMAEATKWGWYEGRELLQLVHWLKLGEIEVEQELFQALLSAPILFPPAPVWPMAGPVPAEQPRLPLEGRELQERRADGYRGMTVPLVRGEGNWLRMSGTLQEKVLLAMDCMLSATSFWFKGEFWLKRQLAVLDAVQLARTAADIVQPLLQLEGMLLESRVVGQEWVATWQGLWRRGLARCNDMRELLLHVAALQEHLLWDSVQAVNRNVFLKLEAEARCQLYIPEPNQHVMVFRAGLLMHVDQYLTQLGFSIDDSDSEDDVPDSRQQLRQHWRHLRASVEELGPVEQYMVATIGYQRYLDPDATPEIEAAGMTIAWPVCWLLLRPSQFGPAHQQPQREIVVPIHVDHTLPDYIVQADVYEQRMRRTWVAGDRFRMFFGGKMSSGKAAGTYYKGTILEVSELQPTNPPSVGEDEDPYDPWEAVLVQWDGSNLEEGTIERVNPWEVEVDPEEEKRRYDELRKQGEAAARAARLQNKTKRLQLDTMPVEHASGGLQMTNLHPPKDLMHQRVDAFASSLSDVKREGEVGFHNSQGDHMVTTTGIPVPERSTVNASGTGTVRLHPTESPVSKAILDQLRLLDKQQLKTLLTNFYRSVKGKYKIPVFAHQELDLHKVFWEVQDRGGYELVTQLKLWKDVCRSLEVDLRGQTSASYNMRLNYEKCLLDFERYLASGQYAADLASGHAPSYTEYTQPVRPSSRVNLGSTSSPAVSGFAATPVTGVVGTDCTSAAVYPQMMTVPLQQTLAPGTRTVTAFTDPSGAQIAFAPALLQPVHLIQPTQSNGHQIEHNSQGGFTSFTELLAADDGPHASQPVSSATASGRSNAPKPLPAPLVASNSITQQSPWLRMVAPPGSGLSNGATASKGWVVPSDAPPITQAEYPIYQNLQPIADENLGSFLHRQGSALHGVKLLRFRQEVMQFITVEVTGYNPNTGEHCLNYDTGLEGSCAAGQEWVNLLHLSNDVLKQHPSSPLNALESSRSPPNSGSRDAVPKDNTHTMDAIMTALLNGVAPEVLHSMVDLAANMVAQRKGGLVAAIPMPSLAPGDRAGSPASEPEPSGATNHHIVSTSAQDSQHEHEQRQHTAAYMDNGPLDHRDSRSLPSHSGSFAQQLADVRHLGMHEQLSDLHLHSEIQQHLQASSDQSNLVDLAAHIQQSAVDPLKGVDTAMGLGDQSYGAHRLLYAGSASQLLDGQPSAMDADHSMQGGSADVSHLYMSGEGLGVAMQTNWSSGLDTSGLLQGRMELHHRRLAEQNASYGAYSGQLVGLGRSSVMDEQANMSHSLAMHYANQALQ